MAQWVAHFHYSNTFREQRLKGCNATQSSGQVDNRERDELSHKFIIISLSLPRNLSTSLFPSITSRNIQIADQTRDTLYKHWKTVSDEIALRADKSKYKDESSCNGSNMTGSFKKLCLDWKWLTFDAVFYSNILHCTLYFFPFRQRLNIETRKSSFS